MYRKHSRIAISIALALGMATAAPGVGLAAEPSTEPDEAVAVVEEADTLAQEKDEAPASSGTAAESATVESVGVSSDDAAAAASEGAAAVDGADAASEDAATDGADAASEGSAAATDGADATSEDAATQGTGVTASDASETVATKNASGNSTISTKDSSSHAASAANNADDGASAASESAVAEGGSETEEAASNAAAANGIAAKSFSAVRAKTSATLSSQEFADGTYAIKAHVSDDKVLDVAGCNLRKGTNVQSYDWNATAAQLWCLSYDKASKAYRISTKKSGVVLSADSAAPSAQTNVCLAAKNKDSASQLWRIKRRGSGLVFSPLSNGDLALDVSGASKENGANVWLYRYNGSAAQLFDLVRMDASGGAGQTIKDGDYVLRSSVSTTQVVDAEGGSRASGTNVQTYESNMTGAQRWHFAYDKSSRCYKVSIVGSSSALTADALEPASGTNVCLRPQMGIATQLWSVTKQSDGLVRLSPASARGLCLDVSGATDGNCTNVQLWASNGTAAQAFETLSKPSASAVAGERLVSDGYYTIVSALGSGRALDVSGASRANGGVTVIYRRNGDNNQRWRFSWESGSSSKGFYRISAMHTGKVLDADLGNLVSGTTVQQWSATSPTENQLWALKKNADGTITIVCRANGLALDVSGATDANGAAVKAWKQNGTTAQKWLLKACAPLEDGLYSLAAMSDEGKVLDVSGASVENGATVQLWGSNGTRAQKFELVSVGKGSYRIRTASSGGWLTVKNGSVVQSGNHATAASDSNTWLPVWNGTYLSFKNVGSGSVLSPKGGKVGQGAAMVVSRASKSAAQHLVPIVTSLVELGKPYVVRSSAGTVLDISGASASDGANLQLWESNDSAAQKFTVKARSGHAVLICAASGKVLDVDASTGNVRQEAWSGSKSELWDFQIGDGGKTVIKNVGTGLVMGANNGSAKNGANVSVSKNVERSGQLFSFERTTTETFSAAQKRVIHATEVVASPGSGYCAMWVSQVFQRAGYGYYYGNANDMCRAWCHSTSRSYLKPGMIVAVEKSPTTLGRIYGHVAIYIGGGKVRDNAGYIRTSTLSDWLAFYSKIDTPRWGWIGGVVLG